jgi:hypothetical protein
MNIGSVASQALRQPRHSPRHSASPIIPQITPLNSKYVGETITSAWRAFQI